MAWDSFLSPHGHAITHPLTIEYHQHKPLHVVDTAPARTTGFTPTLSVAHSVAAGHSDFTSGAGTNALSVPHVGMGGSHATNSSSNTPLTAIDSFSRADILSMKSGVLSHLDAQLAALYQDEVGQANGLHAVSMANRSTFGLSADNQFITIDVTVKDANGNGHIDASEANNVLAQLQGIGLTHGSTYAGVVSGTIGIDHVADLANLLNTQDLGFARASAMQASAGLVESQADVAEHAPQARDGYSVDGTGLRIGVLSDSFDTDTFASDHMADNIASGDLPTDTVVLEDVADGTDEGRAMAQLAHDIAPGAAIDFATAFTGQAGFANNILALQAAGDSVITDDVIYFAELAYQDGPIAQAVKAVTDAGVSYFSSAGNNGNEGWEGKWHSGGSMYGETLMRFANGQDYLPITLAPNEVVILQWDEPGASAGGAGSASDLDFFLTNQDGSAVYVSSVDGNIGGDPVEGFGISGGTGGTYYLRVGLYSGPAPTEIKIVALGNGYPVDLGTTARNINTGTLYGHAAADGANAVGAVRFDATPDWGVNPPDSEYYTSSGPDRIWYDTAGNRLSHFTSRGVDFSAADGANTTFFGGDYDGDGYGNFFGTSAAAPDAAAVALLMLQANSSLTQDDIHNLLADSALDMDVSNGSPPGTPSYGPFANGPDPETGAGFIQADLAVGFASTGVIQNDDAVILDGTHLNDVIIGNGNANVIHGGKGADEIHGGTRGDILSGGPGNDTFVYDSIYDSVRLVRHDEITDLGHGHDTIDLSAIDANALVAGDQAFHLVHHVHHKAGELKLVYHHTGALAGKTTIQGYTNNDHIPDLFIVLDGNHHNFTDFVL